MHQRRKGGKRTKPGPEENTHRVLRSDDVLHALGRGLTPTIVATPVVVCSGNAEVVETRLQRLCEGVSGSGRDDAATGVRVRGSLLPPGLADIVLSQLDRLSLSEQLHPLLVPPLEPQVYPEAEPRVRHK